MGLLDKLKGKTQESAPAAAAKKSGRKVMVLGLDCAPPEHALILGEHSLYVERGASVEPAVCFDLSAGPVLVRAGATVRAFTRLVGPCAIAAGANVLGEP